MAAFGTRDYLNLQCDGTEQWVYGVGGESCFQATLKVKAFQDLELVLTFGSAQNPGEVSVGKCQSNTDETTFKSECCLSHILVEFILCMS